MAAKKRKKAAKKAGKATAGKGKRKGGRRANGVSSTRADGSQGAV